MVTKLIIYWDMSEISDDPAGSWTKEEIIENCFRVRNYEFEGWALDAYANTRCTWSKLVDEEFDHESFIKEATDRILNYDYEWLEENFC